MTKRIKKEKVDPVDFGTPPINPKPEDLKQSDAPIVDIPIPKPSLMFRLKYSISKWALGVISHIPEELLIDFLLNAINKLIERDYKYPNWIRTVLAVLKIIIVSIDPLSEGGRKITKTEFQKIVDQIWP